MTKFYSASTSGFYDNALHGAMPGDAIEITDTLYASLVAGQGAGVAIVTVAGLPALQEVPPTPASLVAYANAKQVALRDGGININVGTPSTPDEVNVATDVDGRSLVSGCVQLIGLASQNGQPAPTFPWINNGGTQLSLTGAQMLAIGYQLGAFVQATYSTLGAVLAAIAAGTITTTAQIDTPPAGVGTWPATSY